MQKFDISGPKQKAGLIMKFNKIDMILEEKKCFSHNAKVYVCMPRHHVIVTCHRCQ